MQQPDHQQGALQEYFQRVAVVELLVFLQMVLVVEEEQHHQMALVGGLEVLVGREVLPLQKKQRRIICLRL